MTYPPLQLNPPPNVTLIDSYADLHKVIDFLNRCGNVFGWDIETDVKKDFFWRRCRTVQVGNANEQYVIDLLGLCGGDPEKLFNEQGQYGKSLDLLRPLIDVLTPRLISQTAIKVGVNLGFEYHMFYWLFGLRTCGFYDCSVVERCIYAGAHSLKDYAFYGMEEMAARYFHVSIDKTLQTSFTLDQPLTQAQIEYAALDTRLPLAIKKYQDIIIAGKTHVSFEQLGLPSIILGDNLQEICQVENDAIGTFHDMHVHGERLDTDAWLKIDARNRQQLFELIRDELDPVFLPIVGSKTETISLEEIEAAEKLWKSYNIVTEQELAYKPLIRTAKQEGKFAKITELQNSMRVLEDKRKETKEILKAKHRELKARRSKIEKLTEQCEGEALVNYGSDHQLKALLKTMYPSKLKDLTSLDDEVLEEFETKIPVMASIRKYHELSKRVGTYGEQWATTWKTGPCKEEGWLHPGDGRLHCTFNQYDAETGRSSSSQPNGQNLPKDKEVRECFIADPPDAEFPDGYKLLTIDMSGAELRILAEEADDPVWIEAFDKDQDVHCVCTELVGPEEWFAAQVPGCAYYKLIGTEYAKNKCKCPLHNAMRDGMKPTNFGLPYGIGPKSLSKQIKKSYKDTLQILARHRAAFPRIWAYLEQSGKDAVAKMKSFDMFGRRRLFIRPTWELGIKRIKEDNEKELRLAADVTSSNLAAFEQTFQRKPTPDEEWGMTHREPLAAEISKAIQGMFGYIERQGKNHRIQSCNASIIKLAMGCGHCIDGKPYLWHTLPKYKAKVVKMVHDELLILVPTIYAETVAGVVQDAFKRAAATHMKKVIMKSDYHVENCWTK